MKRKWLVLNYRIRLKLFICALVALVFFNVSSQARGSVEAGLYIRTDAVKLPEIFRDAVLKARKATKTNSFFNELIDIIDVASRQKLGEIRLYVPEDADYMAGRPHNFAVFINGDFDPGKLTAEFGAVNSPFYSSTVENGLTVLKFHFLTKKNYEDAIRSIEMDGPMVVKLIINFLITSLIDGDYKTVYSVVIVDNKTAVFGSEKFVAEMLAGKASVSEPFDGAKLAGGTAECLVYFKNPGKIINSIAVETFGIAVNKNVKSVEKFLLAHDRQGMAFEARLSFVDSASAAEVLPALKKFKGVTSEKLFSLSGVSPAANFENSAEVFLRLKNIIDSMSIKNTASNEVVLTLNYDAAESDKMRAFFNDAAALVGFVAVSFLNTIHYQLVAAEKSCNSNMITIDGACELYSMEKTKPAGSIEELIKLKYLPAAINCPAGGEYSVDPVGEKAFISCSRHGGMKNR